MWWIAVAPLAGVIAFLAAIALWFYVVNPIIASRVRDRILKADYGEVLAACRTMINNREQYRTDTDVSWRRHEKVLDADVGGIGPDVPAVIRDMKPRYILIGTKRAHVFLYGPPRVGFFGFAPGAEEYGTRKLTNGLWYYNGSLNEESERRIRGSQGSDIEGLFRRSAERP
jgi:hypothetical protein